MSQAHETVATAPRTSSRIRRWWRDYKLYLRLMGIALGIVIAHVLLYSIVTGSERPTDDRIHVAEAGAVLCLFAVLVRVPRARRTADVFASFPALDYIAGDGALLFLRCSARLPRLADRHLELDMASSRTPSPRASCLVPRASCLVPRASCLMPFPRTSPHRIDLFT